jgi:spectinomycin phosphotransferase
VLAPPADLAERDLRAALARGWGLEVASLTYRPVGFGSHHWELVDGSDDRWFVTVDDVAAAQGAAESWADARAGLHAALDSAARLADAGADFVVAPHRAADADVLVDVGEYAISLFPLVTGETFSWGPFVPSELRDGVIGLLARLHEIDPVRTPELRRDDHSIPHRDTLMRTLDPDAAVPAAGRFATPVHALLRAHAADLLLRLDQYDRLIASSTMVDADAVVSHGEPHPGNVMRVAGRGLVLVDWDTVRLAPPERDLWMVDPGDGSALRAYETVTGVRLDARRVDLYRLRWDLADLAAFAHTLGRPHAGDASDFKSWLAVQVVVARLTT